MGWPHHEGRDTGHRRQVLDKLIDVHPMTRHDSCKEGTSMTNRTSSTFRGTDRATGRGTGLLRAAPIAAVLAAVANAIVYAIAKAADTLPADVLVETPGGEQAIGLAAVIFATAVPIILGGAVLALLARFTRMPRQIFLVLAVVLTLLSLISPLTIPDAPTDMKATLVVMHIVAAVVGVGALFRLSRV
jgi:hypothetical protein